MKKSTILHIIVFPILIMMLMIGCYTENRQGSKTTVTTSKETLHDFQIEQNKVRFECELTVSNSADHEVAFEIIGVFSDDQKNGLILESELTAVDPETASSLFRLDGNAESRIKVEFIGSFAGNPVKQDRNPPEIRIQVKE